jgi:hypothetical protein
MKPSSGSRTLLGKWKKSIDEFSIHNVVRSASYIAAISPTNLPPIDANVQLMYHFDEGDGTIAYDASGNHLNATFSIP